MYGTITVDNLHWKVPQAVSGHQTGSGLQDTQWWHVLSLMVFQYDNNDDNDDDEEEEEQVENKGNSSRSNNDDNGNDGDDHEH